MSNIVAINSAVVPEGQPNPEIIERLESLLEDARAGDIRVVHVDVVIAVLRDDRQMMAGGFRNCLHLVPSTRFRRSGQHNGRE